MSASTRSTSANPSQPPPSTSSLGRQIPLGPQGGAGGRARRRSIICFAAASRRPARRLPAISRRFFNYQRRRAGGWRASPGASASRCITARALDHSISSGLLKDEWIAMPRRPPLTVRRREGPAHGHCAGRARNARRRYCGWAASRRTASAMRLLLAIPREGAPCPDAEQAAAIESLADIAWALGLSPCRPCPA